MTSSNKRVEEENGQRQRVFVGEPVWVQCEGFRCLAYLDHKGEWRTYSNGAPLENVIKVLNVD